jgi:hypothetical protein
MNPFLRVIEALNRHDVRYVVVGGFAAYLHGSRRVTVDLDLVVDLHPPETRKAIDALLSIGLQARLQVDPYDFAEPSIRERWIREKNMIMFSFIDPNAPGFILDLFVHEPKAFGDLYAQRKEITAEGLVIRMALPCVDGRRCAEFERPRRYRWLMEPGDGILFLRGQDQIRLFAFLGR